MTPLMMSPMMKQNITALKRNKGEEVRMSKEWINGLAVPCHFVFTPRLPKWDACLFEGRSHPSGGIERLLFCYLSNSSRNASGENETSEIWG